MIVAMLELHTVHSYVCMYLMGNNVRNYTALYEQSVAIVKENI